MSKAALALLAADETDEGEISKTASQRAVDMLEGRAQPTAATKKPSLAMAPVGGAEMLARGVTGAVASVPASVAYGGAAIGRALGLNMDPSTTMANVQEYLTYDPVSESGQAGDALVAQGLGKVVAPVARKLDQAASAVGDVSPTAETYMREAPGALAAATGVLGLSPLAAPAASALRAAPGALASGARSVAAGTAGAGRQIAAAGEAVSDASVRALGGTVRPKVIPEITRNPFESESLGAAAASPELKTASPALRAEVARAAAAGEKIDRVALDRRLEAESLPIPMKLTKGQASQDVEQISHEMNRRGQDPELAQMFNEHNQQLIDNLDEIRAQAAPNAVGNDHVQNGQTLVDAYKRKDAADTAEISAAYKALTDANGGDLPVDGQAFVAAADKALKKSMKVPYLPSQVEATLAEFRDGAPMTFENFENMRTTLAAEARKADRSGDGNAAAAVNRVREALETLPGVPEKYKALADNARGLAKARFDRLRADPAYKAVADDAVGVDEASPLADDFIQKYVVKGKSAHIRTMRENLSADEHAGETIAAGALNYIKSKSGVNLYTNEGNFSQAGFNRALSEISPKLDMLVDPKSAEQIQTLGNVARYTQSQPRGSFVNNSNTTVAAHAANIAKSVAERSVNAVVPGADLGTLAREKLGARADKKFVREALDPASGITKKGKK